MKHQRLKADFSNLLLRLSQAKKSGLRSLSSEVPSTSCALLGLQSSANWDFVGLARRRDEI